MLLYCTVSPTSRPTGLAGSVLFVTNWHGDTKDWVILVTNWHGDTKDWILLVTNWHGDTKDWILLVTNWHGDTKDWVILVTNWHGNTKDRVILVTNWHGVTKDWVILVTNWHQRLHQSVLGWTCPSSAGFYNGLWELKTNTVTSTGEVSKLVFYAQSTSAVIPGRFHREQKPCPL